MLTIIEGLPDHVIGIRINDKLRAEDYEKQLIPLVNEKLSNHRKLDLLCCIDGEWKGMEAGALWPDLRLGLGKIGHWARMAIVSDIKWIENAIKLFRLFSPGELRHFDSDDYVVAALTQNRQNRGQVALSKDGVRSLITPPESRTHAP